MSAIEETIERIKYHEGVEAYYILDKEGSVLRSYPSGGETSGVDTYRKLAEKATHVVRDLDPSDSLNFMRIRCVTKELMIGVHNDYTVVIQQRWQPAAPNA